MASYDLNQVLKNRKATQNSGTMALDDISRVKVLSPGMQVFKRFIRNRLAVFGAVTLIVLFLFSFVGPLFYPYGQKEIFYTFNSQNVNYALAKENTGYNGYDVDSSLSVERGILNAMNSNIKKMTASGSKEMAVVGSGGGYLIREEAPNIYSLSVQELEKVCSIGSSEVKVGTYSMIGKKFDFEGEEIPGLADAAASNIKGAQGSFEADGAEYSFVKGEKPKTYDVFTQTDGIRYEGAQPGGDFEDALNEAVQAGADSFESGGSSYVLSKNGASHDVFSAGESSVAKVYTNYTLDTRETGGKVSGDFRPAALMAAALGAGLPVAEATGSMVIDIGGGTTDIAVISLGDIVISRSVRKAGDAFNAAILSYVKRKYNLLIGERSAEDLKISAGSAFPYQGEKPVAIKGRNLVDGLPKNVVISGGEVREALAEPLADIVEAVKQTLGETPPELSADIFDHGIMLTGGGAQLRGLDKLLAQETGMPVNVAAHPLDCVAEGTGRMLDISENSYWRIRG